MSTRSIAAALAFSAFVAPAVGQEAEFLRSSALIGAEIVDERGVAVGEIVDLAIDAETGEIFEAIVTRGGYMGAGNELFSVPWGALTRMPDGDFVLADAGLDASPLAHGQVPEASGPAFAPGPSGTAAGTMRVGDVAPFLPTGVAPERAARRIGERLIGLPVVAADGAALGEVADIGLDPQSGAPRLAILDMGGALGAPRRTVAVALEQVRVLPSGDAATVDGLADEDVASLPEFEADAAGVALLTQIEP